MVYSDCSKDNTETVSYYDTGPRGYLDTCTLCHLDTLILDKRTQEDCYTVSYIFSYSSLMSYYMYYFKSFDGYRNLSFL